MKPDSDAGGRAAMNALLFGSTFTVGIAYAATAPYRSVVAVEGLGMSNAGYAAVMTFSSIGTAIASVLLGHIGDRVPDRRMIVVLAAIMGALAYGLIYLFPNQITYVLAFCLILPFGGALFSQTLAFSRTYFDKVDPERSEFMMSMLRTVFALAWVIVPPAVGWIASTFTVFDVFGIAALAHLLVMLAFGLVLLDSRSRTNARKRQAEASPPGSWRLPLDRIVGIGGVTLVRMAMALHMATLPLAILNDFGGTLTSVGINAAVAAGLEVPCMIAWGFVARRLSKEAIIVGTALLFGLYLGLLPLARSVTDVLWLQGLNAVATAALLSITISYMQESIRGRVGLSTSLMDVVTVTSTLGAAALFALFANQQHYLPVLVAGCVLCVLGAALVAFSVRLRTRPAVAA